MSYRAYVLLKIRLIDLDRAITLTNDDIKGENQLENITENNCELAVFSHDEITEAVLDFEEILTTHKIPFSKHWDNCDSIEGGEDHFRILNNNEEQRIRLKTSDTLVPIKQLVEARKKGLPEIDTLINKYGKTLNLGSWIP